MSNPLAIAAVTATLRNLLLRGVPDLPNQNVTTKPLDKARPPASSKDQINIFLYQTAINAAWRNMDMPRQVRPGETAYPPLALNLNYLVTAFGDGDDDSLSHRWLGRAMSVFHDHPLLGAQEIHDALLPDNSELQEQIERVRITPQPMSLEDMSKLWTTFQTQYRISAAYQVDVVLIESGRQGRIPLPVLTRGQDDRGVTAEAGANLPMIESVRPPNRQSSALLGDELAIIGQNLTDVTSVRFSLVSSSISDFNPILLSTTAPLETKNGIKVTLPNDASASTAWMAGFFTVAVAVNRNNQTWSSNELPISLAPRIDAIAPPNPIVRDGAGNVTLDVSCSPNVRLVNSGAPPTLQFAQRVVLLLEPFDNAKAVSISVSPEAPSLPAPPSMSTGTLRFVFPVASDRTGGYMVRLRVDGINLPLVDWTAKPPTFDAKQKVTIT
jgi:hypothetical protein